MNSEIKTPNPNAYRASISGASWIDRSSRVRLEISGPDRAKFLHNLTTNDVKRLADGSGQESFVTSPQGKTLAYVTLLAADCSKILLRTEPESLESILPHLNKYGVFEDVEIEDVSSKSFEFHIAGPNGDSILEGLGLQLPEQGDLRHRAVTLDKSEIRVIREPLTGRPGLTLVGPYEVGLRLKALFSEHGVTELDEATFESLRIEAGIPLSGRDVLLNNLPQEVGRDSRTINFVKGCYLGQETVARLDALGHVNRILRGIRLEGKTIPPVGSSLTFEGKPVGSITTGSYSLGWDAPIALAYIRVAQAAAGTQFVANLEGLGKVGAVVCDLPMLPPPN